MKQIEDPAVRMARRALFRNNPIYQSGQLYDNAGIKMHTVKCTDCGRPMPAKGSKLKLICGRKCYLCLDCYGLKYREDFVGRILNNAPLSDRKRKRFGGMASG